MALAYIGLGTNLGDRRANLDRALALLDAAPGVRVSRVASIYETAPVGYTAQPDFLNTVAEVETALAPADLLAVMQRIEDELGRVRTVRWGPRTIDLDLLLYDDLTLDNPALTVPHPRMAERAFVLVPLAELIPDRILSDRAVRDLAREREKDTGIVIAP
ncbi:MAG: 2-amino-4-hydroxy-6-hydroxymethyldihydropteridine diphosphokinase [Thermoanaerobacterales bacterium]|nr:2-amino-4-hydroxy-6-hydroxymethyldihydropteridine diphosphokinase [Thermoanaerobacterales bacterium]